MTAETAGPMTAKPESKQSEPRVVSIHISPATRLPMRPVTDVTVLTGGGIVGDRYENATHRHLTIQSIEELHRAAEEAGRPIDPALTRRNITLSHGEVPLKPGSLWSIGDLALQVVRQAAPCKLLEDTLGPGAKKALHRRAGVVCRVLDGGHLQIGDVAGPVTLPETP